MSLQMISSTTTSLSNLFLLLSFLIFLCHGFTILAEDDDITNIGAIIDVNSRVGKEEKISMEIAIQIFNNSLNNKHKLALHVSDSGGDPLQASTAADELIKEKQVQAIIGMDTWKEAALVTEVANRAQVPILSFAAPSITPPLASVRWPFLVRMASNDFLQMQCVASIVGYYGWRRVIVIYEDDGYSTDSGILALLSDALLAVGSEIEHRSVFPPLSSLYDPNFFIKQELEKLYHKQSRVFIFVRSSFELATHILTEAKHMNLMGKESVWITTDSVANLLDTANSTVMSFMQGIIGIKNHFPETSPSFISFSTEFRNLFRTSYPQEDKSEPGFNALRAYDAISTVALALEKSTKPSSTTTSRTFLENILSSNFSGLSGKIQFENNELSRSATYEIVNVVGKSYAVLKFWSPGYGFSDNVIDEMSTQEWNRNGGGDKGTIKVVYWPGGLDRIPHGWVMPTDAKPMVIGLPGRTQFEKFVKLNDGEDPKGFCIDVFNHALKLLNYSLPHKFENFSGLYDDLVDQVYLKKFDAVVGDITILANRTNYVEFTQPYAETGLTMVVPVKSEGRDWLFVKPFTANMWLVVSIVFMYTMFVVWFLEHRTNPEFRGPWKNQLSTAMWFTFSTLFFAHKETLHSNFTRVVMVVWLFVVFVVTSSYTASLTSMLTVQRLEPTVTDMETLKRTNSPVGCDGDSFVREYLVQVLKFHPDNIINVKSEYDYPEEFRSGRIKAAFLEVPYKRVFLSTNCKGFQVAGPTYRFGGLAFVFPKGSPIAKDFSRAFLQLSEDGKLDELDEFWFRPSSECTNYESGEMKNQSLSLSNFWTLFLVTGFTSTIMLVLYIAHLYAKLRRHSVPHVGMDDSFWSGIKRLVAYFGSGRVHPSHGDPNATEARDVQVFIPSNGEYISEYNTPGHPQLTPVAEIEMPETHAAGSDSRRRVLNIANSFPALDRRAYGVSYDDHKWEHIPRTT